MSRRNLQRRPARSARPLLSLASLLLAAAVRAQPAPAPAEPAPAPPPASSTAEPPPAAAPAEPAPAPIRAEPPPAAAPAEPAPAPPRAEPPPAAAAPSQPAAAPPPSEPPAPAAAAPSRAAAPGFVATVTAERPVSAASELVVRDQELRLRPSQRVADLLRVVPGLITVQHAGGGKATQFLLRGFDADHGTDLLLTVDGMPVNLVSHAHGQGYADTNFIIPELIERIEIQKGPYAVENGDFATAGAVHLVTRRAFPESFATVQGGRWNSVRVVLGASPRLDAAGKLRALIAGEGSYSDGPFLSPERSKKYNVLGKLTYEWSPRTFATLAVASYGGDWYASGQLPARAVDAGQLDRFGAVDPTEGGASTRHSVSLTFQHREADSELLALAYVSRYNLKLFSNFTFFSRDPVNGDGIEQDDDRTLAGLRMSYRRRFTWRWLTLNSSVGISVRFDDIHNGLSDQRARERLRTVAEHDVRETSLALYVKEELGLSRYVRLQLGLRTDLFVFDVTDRREDLAAQGDATSGVRGEVMVSPKASLIVSPHHSTDLFVNFGRGFHSNDARGVVRSADPVTPLTSALGYELGARTRIGHRLELGAALFGLDLDSELVWVGDEGRTEASGASRRLGVEVEARARLLDWLSADLDLTWNNARFTQAEPGADAVPLAPRLTLAAGVTVQTPFGLKGALRLTGLGDRPATEDGFLTAQGAWLLDAFVGYRFRWIEAAISVENLTNSAFRSAQFATTSRLAGEPSTAAPQPAGACPSTTRAQTGDDGRFVGCEDISFTPGTPLNVTGRVTLYF